jgi:hypothetical protein
LVRSRVTSAAVVRLFCDSAASLASAAPASVVVPPALTSKPPSPANSPDVVVTIYEGRTQELTAVPFSFPPNVHALVLNCIRWRRLQMPDQQTVLDHPPTRILGIFHKLRTRIWLTRRNKGKELIRCAFLSLFVPVIYSRSWPEHCFGCAC